MSAIEPGGTGSDMGAGWEDFAIFHGIGVGRAVKYVRACETGSVGWTIRRAAARDLFCLGAVFGLYISGQYNIITGVQ